MGLLTLVKSLFIGQADMLGNATAGRAVTAALRVSARSTGGNGLSWRRAFTTIQDALDAASTDPSDCTLILVAPGTYDINRTGDPTWTGNYEIRGTHRVWAPIFNNHAGATSVMNFTAKVSLQDLAIFTTGSVSGVSFSNNGFRVRKCGFNSSGTTGANTSVHINGAAGLTRGGIMEDVEFIGAVGFTTAIHIENSMINKFNNVAIHDCLVGILFDGAAPDQNTFTSVDIGDCALALDIDVGSEQHFEHLGFHHNTRNVDDEVGDHQWVLIHGQFPIYILPDTVLAGIPVVTDGAADAWGLDTELIALNAIDNPFRIVGVHTLPSAAGWFELRLTAAAGAPWFDVLLFDATKREGIAAPSGTEFIFNADTRISASSRSDSGGDNVAIWLEIQEI